MINYKPTLVEKLNELFEGKYPVVAEDFLTASTELPAISYFLSTDAVRANGDEFGYSDIYFNIKVWDRKIGVMEEIASQIDTMMRSLGFTRIAVNELWFDGLGQKELRYQGLARELFSKGD